MENNTPIIRTWKQFIESKVYNIFEYAMSTTKYSALIMISLCDLFESEKAQVDILDKSTGVNTSIKDFMKSKEFKRVNEILSYVDWTLMAVCFDPNKEDEWEIFPATKDLEIRGLADKDTVDNLIEEVSKKLSIKNYFDAVKDGTYEL